MSKTTLDLSTLSDIADGAHTVKVKAKADGYRDSEFSNEVSYTKATPATFTQVYLTKGSTSLYPFTSILNNMDTSKIYSIKSVSYNQSTDFELRYIDNKWSSANINADPDPYFKLAIVTQTSTSVEFYTGQPGGGSYYSWLTYIALEGTSAATSEVFAKYQASTDENLSFTMCFTENTLISTKSGDKPVQDITYDDDILVWNFDEGKLDYAKPIFIKQEQISDSYWRVTDRDGKTVNLVGSNGKSHRLYNKRTHLFEYPQDISECRCEEIHESVKYYNIVTAYHFNCYANGILTSKRYSNMLYPITDEMKYDKTVKHINTCKREQFGFLTDDEFEKLRLSEMEYSDEMRDEVKHFFTLKVK